MLDSILAHLRTSVPFADHVGIELDTIDPGRAIARLPERLDSTNHIGSVHAGALFTLAEAASGAAMAGALAPVLLAVRPVTSRAEIVYRRIARGPLEAIAEVSTPADDLLAELAANGHCQFPVTVSVQDADRTEVASLTVEWHVKRST
jgi:uncharacterized protein (TIGR00369 family)